MFDLPKFYLKTVTKIGLAVTFIVFASACGHEMIRPQAENVILPTPEPMSPPPQAAPALSHNQNRSGKKHSRLQSSRPRHSRRIMLARGTVRKTHNTTVAKMTPPAPVVLAPLKPMASIASLSPEPTKPSGGMWEIFMGYWVYGLLVFGVAGLFWIASRSRPPVKSKSKRNLIFNS